MLGIWICSAMQNALAVRAHPMLKESNWSHHCNTSYPLSSIYLWKKHVPCNFNPKPQSSRGCRWGGMKNVMGTISTAPFFLQSHILTAQLSCIAPMKHVTIHLGNGEKNYLKNISTAYSKSWFRHPLKDVWLACVIHLSSSSGKHQTPLVCLSIKWYFSHHQSISNRKILRSMFEKHLLTHSWSSCPGGLFLMKAP